MMNETMISIQSVTQTFGRHKVLSDLSFAVPKGRIFAFLGRNGAGKTTTIRMMLGLLKPDRGVINVLGHDPLRDPIEVRRRVGYLAEDQRMFGWMRVSELLKFIAPFYPTWDAALAERFRDQFDLDPRARVKHLSKGQGVRLGLLLALAHRPELVILDDPALGLDPIMRKELMRDIIEHLQGRGVTVFFSSHLLYEVEPVADEVAILDQGRIVRQAETEQLREDVKRLILTSDDLDKIESLSGVLDLRRGGERVAVTVEHYGVAREQLDAARIVYETVDLNLDEIFEAYIIGKPNGDEDENKKPAVERVA